MKKIILSEAQLSSILDSSFTLDSLPQHISNELLNNITPFKNNPSFPNSDNNFSEKMTLVGYNSSKEGIQHLSNIINIEDENSVRMYTQQLISEIQELEKPIRDDLNKLCVEVISTYFKLEENFILKFSCQLVDEINTQQISNCSIKDNVEYNKLEFESADDVTSFENEGYRRRVIAALIAGASHDHMGLLKECYNKIFELNIKLPELYYNVTNLLNYLTFISNNDILEDDTCVIAHYSYNMTEDFIEVTSQSTIFPLLLRETISGILFLLSTSNLPYGDDDKTHYIMSNSHNKLNSLWDERVGVGMWELLISKVKDEDLINIPLLFIKLMELDSNRFHELMKEVFLCTKRSKNIINRIMSNFSTRQNYNKFLDKIDECNSKKKDIYIDKNKL